MLWIEAEFSACLHGVDQTIIDNAIDEWRGRLHACVRQKVDTSSNYYDNIQLYDKRRFIFLSNVTQFFIVLLEITTNPNL